MTKSIKNMISKSNKYFAVLVILIFITQNLFASVPFVPSGAHLNTFDINGTQINADYADVFKYDNLYRVIGTNKYAWDFENRLIQVKDNTDVVKVNYLYDAQGRRIAKVFPDGKKVYYYWLNDWQVIEERDELGNLLRENTLGISIDRPLTTTIYLTALGIDSTPYGGVNQIDVNYHQNSLGNVLALTDNTGNIIERYNYDLYGNVKVQDANGTVIERQPLSNFLFTGRELDLESGLYYFRNRYYSTKLAQFISTDPLDFVDGSNCYAYCNARYADMVDPLGLMKLDKHKESTLRALEMAVKQGNFKLPGGMINNWRFKYNMQIGSTLPDIQMSRVASAMHWKEQLPGIPYKKDIKEKIANAGAGIKQAGVEGLRYFAPNVVQQGETIANWWTDNSLIEPGVDLLSQKWPSLKENGTLRTHFGDMQWQHGMGNNTDEIRENIIDDTIDRIKLYNKYMSSGEMSAAAQELGQVMHYLQDTWTPSHMARGKDGKILSAYNYAEQSPELHGNMDNPDSESPQMMRTIWAGVQLLKMVNEHGNDPKSMREILEKQIYTVDYKENYPNPYSPRASREDAMKIAKPVMDKVLNKFGMNTDKLQDEVSKQLRKYQS